MNITDIQINPGSRYKTCSVNKDMRSARISTVPFESKTISVEPSIIPKGQINGIIASIDYIQKQLNKILTHYPPFFPPGTYQRLDLIKKIRDIQENVERSSLTNELKKTLSDKKLFDNATDKDLSSVLNKLFELRDKLTQKGLASSDKPQNSFINIKV